jgi:purine-nucleoside phosphorylase
LNPSFKKGDLMIITDHINLKGVNPLTGPYPVEFGPRFPDMSQVYDPELVELAREKAMQSGLFIREGVYVGVPGPSLETPAETRFLRMIGADAVGMSTVSQAIVATHCGLKTLAIAVITNVNIPDCMGKTTIEEVVEASKKAGPTLSNLWEKIIIDLPLSDKQDNP